MNSHPFSLAALTVLELSPPDMVEAAARAGYDYVGLRPIPATPEELNYPLLSDTSLLKQTCRRLRDTGIKVADLEILRLKPHTHVINDFSRFMEVGAELGASEILVAGNDDNHERLRENFAALCELAQPFGLYPHLEFMPWTGVKNLKEARHIVGDVRQAGHRNACLLVDAFHLDRSRSRLEELAEVPPEWMRYVQLCDVPGPIPESMDDILHEARCERRFPGDGHADLKGLLKVIPPHIPLSLEVPTDALRRQGVSALERAQMALDKARRVVSP
ncbi:sugar phosphate isomerase/epimerase family protein [Halomonas sp. C22]|uniref:sugar phosphate isomerase/epimerase family protein n=1 Tax=Halomonas sp. C22 TaxID=2580567 RepID=UPI00054A9A43|nr:sugar phosphate isomerase/epimerase [Halomonas sp. C22]KHJ52602.1 xylose isomerase [Halomonas hydrothermalis]